MPYKIILTAVSYVGDTHQKHDEFYFTDGLKSVVKGACNSTKIRVACKGKKHIFSIVSCRDHFNAICDYLFRALLKRNTDKVRVKVQHNLKSVTDEIYSMSGKDDEANMSMLYVDDSTIYATGFGDTHIYQISQSKAEASKIEFSVSSLSDAISLQSADGESPVESIFSWAKCLGQLKAKDEYLIVGSHLNALMGDESICKVFSASRCDTPTVLVDTARINDTSRTVTALHILVKKTFPILWIGLGAATLMIALLLLFLL